MANPLTQIHFTHKDQPHDIISHLIKYIIRNTNIYMFLDNESKNNRKYLGLKHSYSLMLIWLDTYKDITLFFRNIYYHGPNHPSTLLAFTHRWHETCNPWQWKTKSMLFQIRKDVFLSSWCHYKSCASVWMKVSLSWIVRLMKQMFHKVILFQGILW
jgi:hypothetical protein